MCPGKQRRVVDEFREAPEGPPPHRCQAGAARDVGRLRGMRRRDEVAAVTVADAPPGVREGPHKDEDGDPFRDDSRVRARTASDPIGWRRTAPALLATTDGVGIGGKRSPKTSASLSEKHDVMGSGKIKSKAKLSKVRPQQKAKALSIDGTDLALICHSTTKHKR